MPGEVGRASGFVQRASPLTARVFVLTLVRGWLDDPRASLGALARTAGRHGTPISAQGLDQRFGEAAAELPRRVVEVAAGEVVAAGPVRVPRLGRFAAVEVQDTTTIALPDVPRGVWRGVRGADRHGPSGAQAAGGLGPADRAVLGGRAGAGPRLPAPDRAPGGGEPAAGGPGLLQPAPVPGPLGPASPRALPPPGADARLHARRGPARPDRRARRSGCRPGWAPRPPTRASRSAKSAWTWPTGRS